MTHTYSDIKKYLTSKEKFHIKLGLDRMTQILDLLGNPQHAYKTIHIAGTNGKGSTASMLAKILEESGYSTGLFTSPHLLKYNERIKVSSQDIDDEQLMSLLLRVNDLSKKHQIPLTEFEVMTVVGFLYFKEQKVDVAVIEVGLGGRLDATNVINPVVSIITSIGIDHTQRLGDTIEKIAFEKAGVIKPDSSVIVSCDNKGYEVVQRVAKSQEASLFCADSVDSVEVKDGFNQIVINAKKYKLSLLGEYQSQNLALVLKCVEVLEEKGFELKNIDNALKSVSWSARMQYLTPNSIIDGAHNVDAARMLRKSLDKYHPGRKITWFFGALNNKDYCAMMDILFDEKDKVYLVDFEHASSNDFQGDEYSYENININTFVAKYKEELPKENLVVITGSLYLSGDILALLANA